MNGSGETTNSQNLPVPNVVGAKTIRESKIKTLLDAISNINSRQDISQDQKLSNIEEVLAEARTVVPKNILIDHLKKLGIGLDPYPHG